jgi:N utilization substance protein B
VERAILRAGAYELLYIPSVPYRVVINEAVDLAKLLGAEQGHRYVNGVLDRLARSVRGAEAM